MRLEDEIENEYVKQAAGCGILALKFVVVGSRNYPDRINLLGLGNVFFIEFKRSKDHTPRKGQLFNHRKLRTYGYNVYVCWTVEDAMDFLELELMRLGNV